MSKRVEYIKQNKIETTYTTLFLLPMLGFSKKFWGDDFISAYLIDKLKAKVAVVFQNTHSEDLKEIIDVLQSHDEYEESYFDDEEREVVVILKLPTEYKDDLYSFKKGRYREFSNDYKEVLLDVHGRLTGDGKGIYMVDALHPDWKAKKYKADQLGVSPNDLPNGETMSIPDLYNEEYRRIDDFLSYREDKKKKRGEVYGDKQ